MSDKNVERLERYLRNCVRVLRDNGQCVRLELTRVEDDHTNRRLNDWPCPDRACEDEELAALVQEICDYARTDAEAYDVGSRYLVLGYYGSDLDKHGSSSAPLSYAGAANSDAGTLAASPDRLVGMLMRHLENRERSYAHSMATIVDTQTRLLRSAEERYDRLQARTLEAHEIVSAIDDRRHSQAVELSESTARKDAIEAITRKILPAIPVVINKLAGKTILPTNSPLNVVKGLFESLKPHQIETIMAVLEPEQVAALSESAAVLQSSEKSDDA